MSKNKRINFSWYTLKKRHEISHVSKMDNSLALKLSNTSKRASAYIFYSISDFNYAFLGHKKAIWLSLLITLAAVVLYELNRKSLGLLTSYDVVMSPVLQLAACIVIIVFLYNIRSILKSMWLNAGADFRWLRSSAIFEVPTLVILIYAFAFHIDNYIVNSLLRIGSSVGLLLAIIGSARQLIYFHRMEISRSAISLFKESLPVGPFNINGQTKSLLRLERILKSERNSITPLAVVVDGRWGDGKSYVVNDVIGRITENDKSYVVVRFEPWRHVSEEAIITNFYNSLGLKLSELPGSMGIQLDMAALSRSFVSQIDKTGTIESLLSLIPKKTSGQQDLSKANKLLEDTNKRLLFVIDDVDRCLDKDRILRTLQLGLHLGSDIKNSTTIIVGDIQEVIKITNIDESFIQKVIDEHIMVLPPTKKEMLKITNDLLALTNLDIKLVQDQRLDLLSRNVRGLKRVLNGLSQDYEGIGDNLHPQDLYVMNVIKHSYPTIYADIAQNPVYYVPFEYSDYSDENFSLYGFDGERKDSQFIQDQIEHFEIIIEKLGLKERSRRRIISVLEDLFPATKKRFEGSSDTNNTTNSRQQRRERRIGASREYLDRYYLLSTEIDKRHIIENSQAVIKNAYFENTDDASRLKQLKTLINGDDKSSEELFYGGLVDLLGEMSHDDSKRKTLARDMLRLYFEETELLVQDDKRTLLIILGGIDTFLNNDEMDYVFENIEKYMSHPSTGLRLLLYINPTRSNDLYELKSFAGYNKLREKILKKIDEYYITNQHDIIEEDNTENQEWRFTVAQWSTSVCYDNVEDLNISRFNKVNDYLIRICFESNQKFHDLLMAAFWHNNMNGRESGFVFNMSPQPYDAKKFAHRARQILKSLNSSSEIEHDLRNFVKAYNIFKKIKN